MKYLHVNDIDFDKYDAIGFDMDGTLYEERVFIEQAYLEVVNHFNLEPRSDIYNWMLNRWDEKSSSYSFIFSEMLEKFRVESITVSDILNVYRNVNPTLNLNEAVVKKLSCVKEKEIFLVTDGNSQLQRNKFNALNLHEYFSDDNCGFTGDLGSIFYKPNIEILKTIKCLKKPLKSILYIGDRSIDLQFAQNANYEFAFVNDFKEFWGV